jgi:hypothetical protein
MAISVKTDHKLSQNFMSSETKKVNQSKSKKSRNHSQLLLLPEYFRYCKLKKKNISS